MQTNNSNDVSSRLRQIGAATLAGTIGICFAYTSMNLFLSNQRNYLRNFKKFLNAKYNCRIVSQPSPTNENKLIYISDDIKPNDCISDDMFEFNMEQPNNYTGPIYLYRECEMYQWNENRSNILTKYCKIWSSVNIDSTDFEDMENHQNPSQMIESKLFYTKKFTVSNFSFNLKDNEVVTEPQIPIRLLLKYAKLLRGCKINLNGNTLKTKKTHSKHGWYYFSNDNTDSNEIGEIRVRFWIVTKPLSLTVIGTQNGDTISISNNNKNNNICMRCIGKYKLDNALRRLFHIKLINNETGSIFIMTNVALCCCIFSIELLKPIILNNNNDSNNLECNNKQIQKTNGVGVRALLGSVSICGPVYCLSVMYPHIQTLYGDHPGLLNSIGILAVVSIILGGTQRLAQN